MSSVLAVDLGGSALKACLFGPDGEVRGLATVPLAFDEDPTGRSEQDPDVWWQALVRCVGDIAETGATALDDVAAVAICGLTRTQVFLGARRQVLRPAIGFRDTRALGPARDALASPAVAAHPSADHLNAFHPLSRLLWLKHNEPEAWAATRLVLDPKDYLNLRLTGHARSDRISQHWLLMSLRGGSPSLAEVAGIDRDVLPEIGAPHDAVGDVLPGLPGPLARLAGARVFCGSNDTWTGVAGLGALHPGRAYCISGSSEVFGLISGRPAEAEGLITIAWGEATWQIGGPGQNGANALTYFTDLLNPGEAPFPERLAALLSRSASRRPLLFHPYLHGERTPFWDGDLRGGFFGLTAAHGPGDMVRAVMEGIAFVNRTVLQRAETAGGDRAAEIRIAGGGGRSAVWNQIRADVLGRPVLAAPDRQMGLQGCLAIARVGLGLDADIGTAGDTIATDFDRFDPAPAARARYDAMFAVFQESHEAVATTSHRLADIGRSCFAGPARTSAQSQGVASA